MASSKVNTEAAELAIDKLMAFYAFRENLKFDRFDNLGHEELVSLEARINDLAETLIPASMVNMMLYYEAKLARQEVDAGRYLIIKQAVREVLAEEK